MRQRMMMVAIGLAVALSATTNAQTVVSGPVATSTWTLANAPYRVAGTVTVPPGNVLTIEAGVDVLFDVNVPIIVQGAIQALGTAEDSIRFLPDSAAEWSGLRISGGQPSTFTYVRLSGGNASGSIPDDRGGAVYAADEGTDLVFDNVVISGNLAYGGGGGVFLKTGATASFTNCAILDNKTTTSYGGGIAVNAGSVTLSNTRIEGNWAGGSGGGIALDASSAQLTACVVDSNRANGDDGGGICLYNTSDLDMTDSHVEGNYSADDGGGLFANVTSTVVITGTPFIGNTSNSWDGGGALYIDRSTLDMRNSPITDNHASGYYGHGGGLRLSYTTTRLMNCPLSGNTATGSQATGGGMFVTRSDLVMVDCPVTGNSATIQGGGLAIWDYTTAIVKNSPIRGNSTTSANSGGGVRIYNRSDVTIDRSPITANYSAGSGGGVSVSTYAYVRLLDSPVDSNHAVLDGGGVTLWDNATVRLTNCRVDSNTALRDGGGVFAETAELEMLNCTITRNEAVNGAAIRVKTTPNVRLTNVTITENVASGIGGGIRAFESAASLVNSILWNNFPQEVYVDASTVNATYSDIRMDTLVYAGTENINTDPLFADPANLDYLPGPGSPVIDAGAPYDLRDKNGTRIDMGALPYRISELRGSLTDMEWDHDGSPYRIIGSITVPAGSSLVVGPGVDVYLDQDAHIFVNGSMHTRGTMGDSVVFAPWLADSWRGIRVTSTDSSSFAFTRISRAWAHGSGTDDNGGGLFLGPGARVGLSDVVVNECHSDQYGGGVYVSPGAVFTVNASLFLKNYGYRGGAVCAETASYISFTGTSFIADSTFGYSGWGGAVSAQASEYVEFEGCVFDTNKTAGTAGTAGALMLYEGNKAKISNCTFTRNDAIVDHAGAIWIGHGIDAVVERTRITNNRADYGAGMVTDGYGTHLVIDHSLIANNLADVNGGGIRVADYAQVKITNSILWNGTPENVWNHFTWPVNIDVSHSIIGGYPALLDRGPGNMDASPVFVAAGMGDYNLQPISPAIDAGDPDRPLDPDGTRADIGPYPFNQSSLRLEMPVILRPAGGIMTGDTVVVPIRAWLADARGVQLTLVTDASMLAPVDSAGFLLGNAFAGLPNANGTWGITGDTVRVALTSSDQLTISNNYLVRLVFVAVADFAPDQVVPLAWLGYPETSVDEGPVVTADGSIGVDAVERDVLYGDVSGDSSITAHDASLVLLYRVRRIESIDLVAANVSGFGGVSAYDAALILYRVLDQEYTFPVLGGPLLKPASTAPRTLSWTRENTPDGPAWALSVDDPAGIAGAEFTLTTATDVLSRVEGVGNLEYSHSNGELVVALARTRDDDPVLFRVFTAAPVPEMSRSELNEGAISVDRVVKPAVFGLAQNMPNPFNPSTTIQFSLEAHGETRLLVYSVTGQLVRTLVSGQREAGWHTAVWDGTNDVGRAVGSGIYIYRVVTPSGVAVKRMTLVR
jgi:hypothetical protein